MKQESISLFEVCKTLVANSTVFRQEPHVATWTYRHLDTHVPNVTFAAHTTRRYLPIAGTLMGGITGRDDPETPVSFNGTLLYDLVRASEEIFFENKCRLQHRRQPQPLVAGVQGVCPSCNMVNLGRYKTYTRIMTIRVMPYDLPRRLITPHYRRPRLTCRFLGRFVHVGPKGENICICFQRRRLSPDCVTTTIKVLSFSFSFFFPHQMLSP